MVDKEATEEAHSALAGAQVNISGCKSGLNLQDYERAYNQAVKARGKLDEAVEALSEYATGESN